MLFAVAGAREENSGKVTRQTTGQGLYPFLKEEPQIWRVSPKCCLCRFMVRCALRPLMPNDVLCKMRFSSHSVCLPTYSDSIVRDKTLQA